MKAFVNEKKGGSNSKTILGAFFFALVFFVLNSSSAMADEATGKNAQSGGEQLNVSSVSRSFQASLEMKQTTLSIICFMLEKCPNEKDQVSVKVPSHVYTGVLQELQDRHASFLPASAPTPAAARAVFKLKAEDTGLEQTVCLY
jgi:hypothetical protein